MDHPTCVSRKTIAGGTKTKTKGEKNRGVKKQNDKNTLKCPDLENINVNLSRSSQHYTKNTRAVYTPPKYFSLADNKLREKKTDKKMKAVLKPPACAVQNNTFVVQAASMNRQ